MKLRNMIALCLSVLLIGSATVSCKGKSNEPQATAEAAPSPLAPEAQTDYTENAETVSTLNALRESFSAMTDSETFEYSEDTEKNGMTVTRYTGNAASVKIPAAVDGKPVTAIQKDAFAGCAQIERLYIPDTVTQIEVGALADCEAMIALRTPMAGTGAEEGQYLGALFGADGYANNPMHVPATLVYLELGGTADTLADYALFDCNDLLLVSLPTSVTAIGKYAFYSCTALVTVNTEHLTSVAPHAFDRCASLSRVDLSSAQQIGLGAFEGCVGIRRMVLPFVGGSRTENTYLGYIFGASVVDFSAGYYPLFLSEVALTEGCERLGENAFFECETLTRVTLPSTLFEIGIRAFSGCERLASVSLPNGVRSVAENAFFDCKSLSELSFGSAPTLQSLGINAFYGCISLTAVVLPDTLTALPASCFADCTALKSINLGGVTQVGKNAFRNCTSLTTIRALDAVKFEKGNDLAKDLLKSQK